MAFWDFIFGKPDQAQKFQTMDPQQQQIMQQLMMALTGQGGPLQDVFGEYDPNQTADLFQRGVAEPAMRNFKQRVIPGIQQSFADQGASSGLGQSLAYAGRDLEENLGSQLAQWQQQARMQQMQQRMGGVQGLLNMRTFQPYVQQGYASPVMDLLRSFGPGIAQSAFRRFSGS